MESEFDVPVAFITFNRPEVTRQSFEPIRRIAPRKLFLISDAPRTDRPGEASLVEQTRQIASSVDWPCEVSKIYAQTNMGCGARISSGISQILKTEETVIVLEDDCVANESFFLFCQQLLQRYHDDQRVMAITGNNFQNGISRTAASYYFSKFPHCWGWATWRRAWKHFSLTIPEWPEFRDAGHLRAMCPSKREATYWSKIFDQVHALQSASWAYPWTLNCWMNHGLTITPDVNLVRNIGFGADATHTQKQTSSQKLKSDSLTRLVHPDRIHRHDEADRYTDAKIFSGTVKRRPLKPLENWLRKFRKPHKT